MDRAEQIRQRLKEMASEVGPDASMLAQVKSVNEEQMTCDLYDDESGLDFFDVRLRPVLDGKKSVTMIPKIETWVLAIRIEDSDDWMIIATGEIEKLLISCDNVVINDGENGGLVNWPEAKQQLDKTNEVVNALVDAIANWPVTPNDGGAALKAYFATALGAKVVGNFNDLEDMKVKH